MPRFFLVEGGGCSGVNQKRELWKFNHLTSSPARGDGLDGRLGITFDHKKMMSSFLENCSHPTDANMPTFWLQSISFPFP